LEDVKPKKSLEATILRLQLRYFGHVMRVKRSLERDIMLGQAEGHTMHGKLQECSIWAHYGRLRKSHTNHPYFRYFSTEVFVARVADVRPV
jgi:hypothetical protein